MSFSTDKYLKTFAALHIKVFHGYRPGLTQPEKLTPAFSTLYDDFHEW